MIRPTAKPFLLMALLAAPAVAQTPADSIQWRSIGPTYPGRVVAVAGTVARPDEYYMGTTGGGVWKTTDGGKTAFPVTDDFFGGTIGAIAVAAVESRRGVGGRRRDADSRQRLARRRRVEDHRRRQDLDEHRAQARRSTSRACGLHPTNPDLVYVAALGHVFGPNPERGDLQVDGRRKTWSKMLVRERLTGARPRHGSVEPEHALRGVLAGGSHARGCW